MLRYHWGDTLPARTSVYTAIILISILLSAPLPAQNNALWIWNTRQIMAEPEWKDSLLFVSERLSVNTLFLFFPYSFANGGDSLTWYQKDSLVSLLRWSKAHGFIVHALAGEPEWALPSYHNRPQTYARAVMALRQETGFPDGVQLDVEPYLLLPYSVPATRDKLLKDWIYVVWKTGSMLRQNSPLKFGCAIPFWMERPLTVDGVTMPVAQHLSFLTDYLAVMAYRYKASGPASVISFSDQERRWAREGDRKLYIGVETQRLPGGVSRYLCEADPDTFAQRFSAADGPFQEYRFNGFKVTAKSVDDRFLIGISGSDVTDAQLPELRSGLIAASNGRVLTLPFKKLEETLRLEEEGEKAFRIPLDDGTVAYGVRAEDYVRSTMFGLAPEDFMTEYGILLRHADRFPEVEGIAVHDLRSIRRLLEKR